MLLTIFYGHLNDAINHHIKQLMMHLRMLNFRKFINRIVIRREICVFVCRRLRLLAQRSEYFRSELTSLNHQTFFLPNDQAFASFGSGLSFLFDQTTSENTNDINDVNYFVKINKKRSSMFSVVCSLFDRILFRSLCFQLQWTQRSKSVRSVKANG